MSFETNHQICFSLCVKGEILELLSRSTFTCDKTIRCSKANFELLHQTKKNLQNYKSRISKILTNFLVFFMMYVYDKKVRNSLQNYNSRISKVLKNFVIYLFVFMYDKKVRNSLKKHILQIYLEFYEKHHHNQWWVYLRLSSIFDK